MKDTSRTWSRDWADFDWDPIFDRLSKSQMNEGEERDITELGISPEEMEEYCEWLSIYDPDMFRLLQDRMRENGMEDLGSL